MLEPKVILAMDCGSTTSKAILIEKRGEEYRLIVRGEAPTTVEAPFDDVTIGVVNAIKEVEELAQKKILSQDNKIIMPLQDDGAGVDIFVSTSSAGGGLQMTVAGVVKSMTAESAQRAALGAGAIVMDVLAVDDGREIHQKVERIRNLRPDMILMSGGTDGGTITHLVDLAEVVRAADPKPRLGTGFKLPLIYAGNKDARQPVKEIVGEQVDLRIVENIRPKLEEENLVPAREAIHQLFLEHVMSHAPGYDKLMTWTSAPIMSTPAAFGKMIESFAQEANLQVIAVDIGGATTDIFSVFQGVFNRTVSANLGLSYSVCNVLNEAGVENILRWIPFEISPQELRDSLRNKMIRPTTIPQTQHDLLVEQAVAREALRLAFEHHKSLAVGLKGIKLERTIAEALTQARTGETLIDMMNLDIIIGSGGVLSHAPQRHQAALMLLDAFQPQGITKLAVDSVFMIPHLGVLSTVYPKAAFDVFKKDCLISLGTAIAPLGIGKEGEEAVFYRIEVKEDKVLEGEIKFGEIRCLPLGPGETAQGVLQPSKKLDLGAGKGKIVKRALEGGVVGVIFDCRGRPLVLPQEEQMRRQKLQQWLEGMQKMAT